MIGGVSAGQRVQRRWRRCYPHAEHTWTLQKFKRPSRNEYLILAFAWPCRSGRHKNTKRFFVRRSIDKNGKNKRCDNENTNKQTNKRNHTKTILSITTTTVQR